MRVTELLIALASGVAVGLALLWGLIPALDAHWSRETQPAIQTVIVNVRGCDVIQHVQDDKLIAAHNAADQPKTCKVRYAK